MYLSEAMMFVLSVLAFLPAVLGSPIEPRGAPYRLFQGDGTPAQGWPSANEWWDFDALWESNMEIMRRSCSSFGQAPNSEGEIWEIRNAIMADQSGVDKRFILAIVLQESGGCVRAPTTNWGVNNPGLMQTHNGGGSCWNVSPCPADMIHRMVHNGAAGTYDDPAPGAPGGDGLKQTMDQAKWSGAWEESTIVYRAARIYNTGSYPAGSDLSNPVVATKCYATDVANRLTGFNGLATECHLDHW